MRSFRLLCIPSARPSSATSWRLTRAESEGYRGSIEGQVIDCKSRYRDKGDGGRGVGGREEQVGVESRKRVAGAAGDDA